MLQDWAYIATWFDQVCDGTAYEQTLVFHRSTDIPANLTASKGWPSSYKELRRTIRRVMNSTPDSVRTIAGVDYAATRLIDAPCGRKLMLHVWIGEHEGDERIILTMRACGTEPTGADLAAISAAIRDNMIRLLHLLSSKTRQLEYQRDVPFADVGAELRCMWFDDLYRPDTVAFQQAFNETEHRALAEFDAFYRDRKGGLPTSIEGMQDYPGWDEICDKARSLWTQLS